MKLFHSYQQLHSSDCGQTCIRMILRHYGIDIDYAYLCSLVDSDRQGLTISEIVRILEKLEFDAHPVRITIEQLHKMPLPSILFWKGNHYVILYKIDPKRDKYYIADPAKGKLKLNAEQIADGFINKQQEKGIAVALAPKDIFGKADYPKDSHRQRFIALILNTIKNFKKSIFGIIILTILILIMDFITPFLFQYTIDDGIRLKDINLIWLLVGSQICIFLGNYVANSIGDFIITKIGLSTGISYIETYIKNLIKLPLDFYNRYSPADLIQRVDDHNRIRDFLLTIPASGLFTLLNICIFGGILIYYSGVIAFIFFFLSILNLGWMLLFLRFRKEIDFALSNKSAESRNNVYEIINGIDEIKIANASEARTENWYKSQQQVNNLTIKSAYLKIYQNGGNLLMIKIRDVVITGICACLVTQDSMTIGIMMTISYVCGQLAQPFSNILNYMNSVQDSLMAFQRIDSIPIVDKKDSSVNKLSRINTWTFTKISYKYPGEASPFILNNCNFNISIGRSLAIVGESGSGKSTLLKIIAGLLCPMEGEILINGSIIGTLYDYDLNGQLGCVLQNGIIFSSTILENIAIGDSNPDMERAIEVARIACIHDFIERLPLMYDTRIGKTGMELSGGQKQRLLIARALYNNPEILILDEATSSLDCGTESIIMDNIYKYYKDRTLIIAAHRLSTVYRADHIMLLDGGQIVEAGTHNQLLAINGKYKKLIDSQIIKD